MEEERWWKVGMDMVDGLKGVSLVSSSSSISWTLAVMIFILTCHLIRSRFFRSSCKLTTRYQSRPPPPPLNGAGPHAALHHQIPASAVISDSDLKNLIESLDGNNEDDVTWEDIIQKSNTSLSYKAMCSKSKDGPLDYLSVTVFENCTVEHLVNFYMDNEYRKVWDKTVVEHERLQLERVSGTEIGRTVKKFTFLTPREYVLSWKLWQASDGSFYCFSKECEHPLAPKQKKYVRVSVFRSGWRIRKVPDRNACEIKMFHREDAGLNVDMAKLAFSKGIWSYMCKMDNALRSYPAMKHHIRLDSADSAIWSIQKVPREFEVVNNLSSVTQPENSLASSAIGSPRSHVRKLSRRPSSKLIANGLVILGGAICLSRGHSSLGSKVAMAYILSKITKHRSFKHSTHTSVQ